MVLVAPVPQSLRWRVHLIDIVTPRRFGIVLYPLVTIKSDCAGGHKYGRGKNTNDPPARRQKSYVALICKAGGI